MYLFLCPNISQGENCKVPKCANLPFSHENAGACEYSYVSMQYNQCMHAHGQEELDEWKERQKYRKLKRQKARDKNVFSFMDTLLERLQNEETNKTLVC